METEKLLELATELECRVMRNEPLSEHTTFKIGGNCTAFIDISGAENLSRLVRAAREMKIRTMVLGKGSNVLFDDRGFDGVIFFMSGSFDGIAMQNDNTIFVQAGCSLVKLCRFALEHNLKGLEFAYGIPGSVGGAIYMNAGAYGGEINDVVHSCHAVSVDGKINRFLKSDMNLSYRHSVFQENEAIVTDAYFTLESGIYDDIQDKMVELMGRRRDKQPLEYASAGSTFKRPEGKFAGQLIEESGLRGYSIGGAQVSQKHCGFIVNKGGATSEDVMKLIKYVQETVYDKTGTELESEVRLIPYQI